MSERPILFVGDIQGCAAELERLLDESGFRPGEARLIPVGDTINRGPDAPRVLRILHEAGAEPILGNHERHVLAAAKRHEPGAWRGKGDALEQLRATGELEAALDWMLTWPLFHEGADWVVVHAGLHPRRPLAETDAEFLTEVRYCSAEGHRPEEPDGKLTEAPPGYQPWYEFYDGPRTVIFGHWARVGLVIRGPLRGLDSGCVYGGALTGLWWPEDRLVHVPSQQPYRRLPDAPP